MFCPIDSHFRDRMIHNISADFLQIIEIIAYSQSEIKYQHDFTTYWVCWQKAKNTDHDYLGQHNSKGFYLYWVTQGGHGKYSGTGSILCCGCDGPNLI